jgi:zinc transport system permease protein
MIILTIMGMITQNITITPLMDDFVVRALAAGLGLALVAGPLGCFVVWRRMAYFGATLAHAALLGIALGFLFDVNPTFGIIFVCAATSVTLVGFQRQKRLSDDTVLGILAHGSLAAGLIVISFMDQLRVDLLGYLFGDILAVTATDVGWIYGCGAISLLILGAIWRQLLSMTVHEDMARVEGVPITRIRLIFMLLIAVVIAVAMKIVGILLIVSVLIIPAAAARRLSASPEQMAIFAALIGCVAVAGGMASSMTWDTPTGPSIVTVAALIFFAIMLIPLRALGKSDS